MIQQTLRAPGLLSSILLAVAMLLNSAAAVAAPATTMPADHGAHHGHGGTTDGTTDGEPADRQPGSCCQMLHCDCGCTLPHAAIQLIAVAPRGAISSSVNVFPNSAYHALRASGTPFRPPA